MAKVFLAGVEYDDFCEGGFSVIGVGSNMEEAEKIAEAYKRQFCELRNKRPGIFRDGAKTKPPKISFNIMELNRLYSPF